MKPTFSFSSIFFAVFAFWLAVNPVTATAQTITYFTDDEFKKPTDDPKARYQQLEQYLGDTLWVKQIDAKSNKVLSERKWLNGKEVGKWTLYNYDKKSTLVLDFSKLKYTAEVPEGVETFSPECTDCKAATFPGGEAAMFKWLSTHLNYPEQAKDRGAEGTVYIGFIVDETGMAKPHEIKRGADIFLDLTAWQLVEQMPLWSPATKNGKAVSTLMFLPVKFSLR